MQIIVRMETMARMQSIVWILVLVFGVDTASDARNESNLEVPGDVMFTVNVSQPLPNNSAAVETFNSDVELNDTEIQLGTATSEQPLPNNSAAVETFNSDVDLNNTEIQLGNATSEQPLPNNSTAVETFNSGVKLNDTEIQLGTATSEQNTTKETTLPPPKLFTFEQGALVSSIAAYINYPIEAVGVVFCAFSVVVYSKKEMQSSSSAFLLAVNLGELTTLLFNILLDILTAALGPARFQNLIHLAFQIYMQAYVGVCITRSTFFYVFFLTLSRFLAVAFPLKFRQMRIFKQPAILVVMTLVILLAAQYNFALKYEVHPKTSQTTNETVWGYRFTRYYQNNREWMDSLSFAATILFAFLPLIASFFVNIGTVVALYRHKQNRNDMVNNQLSVNESRERQMTRTILTSSFLFLLLNLPINVSSLVSKFHAVFRPGGRERYLFTAMLTIGKSFEILTTCIDFICYITLSSQFRKTFKELFKNCKSSHFTKRQKKQTANQVLTI